MQKTNRYSLIHSSPIQIFTICVVLTHFNLIGNAVDVIPKVRSTSVYKREFQNSIFLRQVEPQVTTVAESSGSSFGKNWFLEGVLEDESGELTVFILDEKENVIIAPSEKLKVVNHSVSNDVSKTTVTLSNGQEQVVLKFRDNPLRKVRLSSNAKSRQNAVQQRQNNQAINQALIANPPNTGTVNAGSAAKNTSPNTNTTGASNTTPNANDLINRNRRSKIILPKSR